MSAEAAATTAPAAEKAQDSAPAATSGTAKETDTTVVDTTETGEKRKAEDDPTDNDADEKK